ncbi:MAG: DUF721 domain-containing protein [Thermodesulfovibrionales bacterium]
MKKAGDLLIPFIKSLGIEDNIRLSEIKKKWNILFKDPLLFHIYPLKLSEGEILINVNSPIWLHELNYYKDDIVKKLSGYGVKEVRFRLGRVLVTTKDRGQKKETRALTAEECSYVNELVSRINDQELKDKIKKAIEKSITTQKMRNSKY